MKSLMSLLVGAILGGAAVWLWLVPVPASTIAGGDPPSARPSETPSALERRANEARDSIREGAEDLADEIRDRLDAWDLEPEDVREDLERTGSVVRRRAREVAGDVSDRWIETRIEGRLAVDPDLSARRIEVHADAGRVTLEGTAASPELIGRAVALALDTDGVDAVESRLEILAEPAPAG